jgi:hypothetical protein
MILLFTACGNAFQGNTISGPALDLVHEIVQANRSNFSLYVDSDSGYNKGFPSGFFPGGPVLSKIHLDTGCVYDPQSANGCATDRTRMDRVRGTVMRISFDPLASGEFVGINIEEPENWGVKQTGIGYDIRGATQVCLDALSPSQNFQVQFGVGGHTGAFLTLSNQWTNTCLNLSSLGLTQTDLANVHILFTIVSNDIHAGSGGTVLLDNIRFDPLPTIQTTALSFPLANKVFGVIPAADILNARVPIPPDQVLPNLTTIYESSLALIALLARGNTQDLTDARLIADTFVYSLSHDNQGLPIPPAMDGSAGLHNAMMSGDVSLHNDQGTASNQAKQGQVRLAGFSIASNLCGPTHFCLVLDGSTGGNSAFAIMALEAAYQQFQDTRYLDAARTIGNWIFGSLLDKSGTGFGGYFLGYPDQGQPKVLQTGKSIENNADIFRAMITLSEITAQLGLTTESQQWSTRAKIAGDFVIAMFDSTAGRFNAGTVPVGTTPVPGIQPDGATKGNDVINTAAFLDAQTFTTLPLAQSVQYHNAIDWRRPIQWMLDHYQQSVTAGEQEYQGFSLVATPTAGPNSVDWEFTGQAIVAMRLVDAIYGQQSFETQAQIYLEQIRRAQTLAPFGDGRGLVAATMQDGDLLPPYEQCATTPFQCISERVGLAATTWAILADLQVNPFAPSNDQPLLTNPAVSPNPLPGGGVITLSVSISSSTGVASASAQITNPDFTFTTVPLALQTGTASSGTWGTTFNIPDDSSLIGKNYLVSFSATDTGGNSSSSQTVTLPVGQPGQNTPIIKVTGLPAFNGFGSLTGQALNVDPTKFQVAVLLFINGFGWVSKPACNQVYVPLAADGTFSANVTSGGVDQTAIRYAAYLVPLPATFTYNCVVGVEGVPGVLDLNAVARTIVERPNPNERIIDFAGYKWGTKTNSIPLGPGGNNFSDSTQNIFIDSQGALHLKIINVNGKWFASEIYSKQPVGYGTYVFDIISPLDTLDSNVVAGFFTWTDNPAFSHREIDFEASRFNKPSDTTNAQFALQPFTTAGHLQRFTIPPALSESTYGFHWTPAEVSFVAAKGNTLTPPDPSLIIDQFSVPAPAVPAPDESARMNLWIFNPPAPNNGQTAEVVIKNFQYIPDTTIAVSPGSLDFGTQTIGTSGGVQTVTLSNSGDAPTIIFNIMISGDFVLVPSQTTCTGGNTLLVGSSCVIAMQFTATAVGQRNGTLTINNNTNQPAIALPLSGVSQATLSVMKQGTGSGTVTSNEGSINCGSICSANFTSAATITLTPAPATGSVFTGWGGACSGTQTCTVTMNASQTVSATFTQQVQNNGLRFKPVTPCRVADTRNPNGPFGGPFISGGTTRPFVIPNSSCNIPATAQAYSINVTVVPKVKLGFLTMFPCGQAQPPPTSTLNSDGRVKAEAVIVPAGTSGAVCAFATDDTDLVLDINGYFVPATDTSALAFFPLTPCRLVDTRTATAPLGGPSLAGNATRTFPILSSPCNVPSAAQAYSLNYTSVPKGKLSFLTTWPAGQTQPLVSTLNAPTGTVTANAAIVPAGTNGDVSVFVTDNSDLVIDINGYFGPPGSGGISLFTLMPCRVLDTRVPAGSPPFQGKRDVNVVGSGCGAPGSAQAFVLNATVVPPGPLGFLTLWPHGSIQPPVSTLNAGDGAITSNMAIVPTADGSISAFASDSTHLVLDISGYFAP